MALLWTSFNGVYIDTHICNMYRSIVYFLRERHALGYLLQFTMLVDFHGLCCTT